MTIGEIIGAIAILDRDKLPTLMLAITARMAKAEPLPPASANGIVMLVDAAQAAAALNVPESQIRTMARQGKIPSVRAGKKYVRFEIAAVAEALKDAKC